MELVEGYDGARTMRTPGGLPKQRRLTTAEAAEVREARLALLKARMGPKPGAGVLGPEERERQLALLRAEEGLRELEEAVREKRVVRFAGICLHELRGYLATIEGRELPPFRVESY
jgi:hypothetical protein